MSAILIGFAILAVRAQLADPNRLQIGRPGLATVTPGQIVDLRERSVTSLEGFLKATDRSRFVFLGEQHATAAHQLLEAQVIRGLAARGRKVIVGVEMYQRPTQDVLDDWSAGRLGEEEFLTKSEWKTQWGFPFAFYRPVFEAVRDLKLPILGLNIPRAWVHATATGGFEALPTSAKLQLPADLFLGNKEHRQIFDAMMGGHSMAGTSMDRMYSALVLWDESMADTALKYLERVPTTRQTVFVVIAGAGHVMYGQGINYRIARRHGGSGTTLVMLESDSPLEVSRGLADFAMVSAKPDGRSAGR